MSIAAPRILLVDDDADLLQLIAMRLTASGYTVTAVGSGEAALASFAVQRPDAIVTDLRMRGMDGMALFDAIHRQAPTLPVVILTTSKAEQDMVKAYALHANSYLVKPVDFLQFTKLMETFGYYWLAWNQYPH